MRRKKAVIAAAFLSGISLLLSEAAALPAYATEEIQEPAETEEDGDESGMQEDAGGENGGGESTDDGAIPEEIDGTEDMDAEFPDAGEGGADDSGEDAEPSVVPEEEAETASVPVRLQVPQKFNIVLNPWEMDGQEQIYSAEYTIKNVSGEKGTLKLTGIAVGTGEDIAIRPDSDDIHDGNDQNIWIAMVINGEETIALSPDGSDYETVLETDADVTLTFTGAMNENVANGWRDSDVEVSVIYDWMTDAEKAAAAEAIPPQADEAAEENGLQQAGAAEEGEAEQAGAAEESEPGQAGTAEEGEPEREDDAEGGKRPEDGVDTEKKETPDTDAPGNGDAAEEKTPNADITETEGAEEEPSDADAAETGTAAQESGSEEVSTEKEDETEQ